MSPLALPLLLLEASPQPPALGSDRACPIGYEPSGEDFFLALPGRGRPPAAAPPAAGLRPLARRLPAPHPGRGRVPPGWCQAWSPTAPTRGWPA